MLISTGVIRTAPLRRTGGATDRGVRTGKAADDEGLRVRAAREQRVEVGRRGVVELGVALRALEQRKVHHGAVLRGVAVRLVARRRAVLHLLVRGEVAVCTTLAHQPPGFQTSGKDGTAATNLIPLFHESPRGKAKSSGAGGGVHLRP